MGIYKNGLNQVVADTGRIGSFADRAFIFTMTALGWTIGRPVDPEFPERWTSFTNQPHRLARLAAGRLLSADEIRRVSALADPMQRALVDEVTWKFRQYEGNRTSPAAPQFSFCYPRGVSPTPLDLGAVFLWCEHQFGRPRKRWEFAPASEPKNDIFHFRDPDMAFAFKMRWC